MPQAFSFNREFDFLRLDGLRRAAGRPPHEWDIYIVKELLDNALDADDALWQQDQGQHPLVQVTIEYRPISGMKARQFSISVSNRAPFPVEPLQDIFIQAGIPRARALSRG